MTITSKPLVMGELSPTAIEIDQFTIGLFAKKCEQFHEDAKAFAAFILNVSGTLQLASLSCSPNEDTDRRKLHSKTAKNEIMHKNPLVLARRGLIRFLIREAKRMETNEGKSEILEKNDDGELQLKSGCHVYMYSTYSYLCENVYWGWEGMKTHDTNHCIMNKIRRWAMLGVQGALLSTVFSPIYITRFVLGASPPVPIEDLWMLLFEKLDFQEKQPPTLEAIERPPPNLSLVRAFVWHQGQTGIDVIGENGKSEDGSGSSVCKEEIFRAFLQLGVANKKVRKYSKAKKEAGHYQALKKRLYRQWEAEQNGKWMKKKGNKVDKFWIKL
uniref:A to I editase domain-containing protein n=1 Tax=Caenorhabditis tropicalis TaxID=1561998 RepID=A0A1I7UJG5_9PELO